MPKKTQDHQSRYFAHLRFDEKLKQTFIAKYLTNIRLVLLLVLTVTLMGIVSYFQLPKRLNPEIQIPIVSVVTTLPGASPEDIEQLVTIPIENQIRSIAGIDVLSSSSQENVSVVSVQFLSSVTPREAETEVQSAVDALTDLPDDTSTPRVRAFDFEDQPVVNFVITSKQSDIPSLMRFARDLEDKLIEEQRVDRVQLQGFETQEILIEVRPADIAQYGLSPVQLSTQIRSALAAYPAGSVSSGAYAFSLTINPAIESIQSLRDMVLQVAGTTVKLGEIADIRLQASSGQGAAYFATADSEPTQAVTFSVYKTRSANIVDTASRVEEIVEQFIAESGDRFTIQTISNTGEAVGEQFSDLLGEFRTTMLLVFVCLFVFLGLRQAVIASLTVPLTFLSAFIFMNVLGMSINFLSLFAFLLALGLLVDDSIVIVSAMTTYFRTGKLTAQETGLLVWRDTIVPIWSTTLTTIWSFAPLLLASGLIGEFIKPIPVVVTVTMLSSTAIAVFVTLPSMIVLLQPQIAGRVVRLAQVVAGASMFALLGFALRDNPLLIPVLLTVALLVGLLWRIRVQLLSTLCQIFQRPQLQRSVSILKRYSDRGVLNFRSLERAYYRLIVLILKNKTARRQVVIAGVVFTLVAFALLPLGLVQSEFFPKTDGEQLRISLELPAGSQLSRTRELSLELLQELRATADVEFVTLAVGSSQGSGFSAGGQSTNASAFTLFLGDPADRDRTSAQIADEIRDRVADLSEGEITVAEESAGPPAGADVQLKISGQDLAVLEEIAGQVMQYLEQQDGVLNVDMSLDTGTSGIIFVPDEDRLASVGLTTQAIGLFLRTSVSGFPLAQVNWTDTDDQDTQVVFRSLPAQPSIEELGLIVIPTPTGELPLQALGSFATTSNPVTITREDNLRTLSVTAAVEAGYSISSINADLLTYAQSLSLPSGYSFDTGGVNEENTRSVQSILRAMIVAFVLILVTMVVQFGSYRQAVIVILVIPLAVSSVFYAFGLFGIPLSFPALIGVLSLFGIVVTNSMFIVDKINLNRKQGMTFIEAIADGGSSRLEPILLTKFSTVFGLLPITLADPLWRGLGGAIISGLILSSTIMLLFIPVVYYAWFHTDDAA